MSLVYDYDINMYMMIILRRKTLRSVTIASNDKQFYNSFKWLSMFSKPFDDERTYSKELFDLIIFGVSLWQLNLLIMKNLGYNLRRVLKKLATNFSGAKLNLYAHSNILVRFEKGFVK